MIMSIVGDNEHQDLVSEDSFPSYAMITQSPWLFEEASKILEETPVYSKGLYGLRIAKGQFRGMDVSIILYGIGSSELIVLLEELYRKGIRVIGKLDFGVCITGKKSFEAVLAMGAIRLDRILVNQYPLELPAIPNFNFVNEIEKALGMEGISREGGLVISLGTPVRYLENGVVPEYLRKIGINFVDVDTATFYVISLTKKIKAASIIIPALSGSEASDYGLWVTYTPRRKREEEQYNKIITAFFESLYQFKEKAEMESETKRYERDKEKEKP